MIRRIKKRALLAWVLVFSLLWALLPAAAWADGTEISPDWLRSYYTDTTTNPRANDLPTVDKAGQVYTTDSQGYLYCISPDQTLKWKVNLGQSGDYAALGGVGPVLDQAGNCYIASGDKRVYGINAAGQVLWTAAMEGQEAVAPGTSPALSADGKTLYVVSPRRLYALNTSDGSRAWVLDLICSGLNTPVVSPQDGTIYVASTVSVINAVKPDGTLLWAKDLEKLPNIDGQGQYTNFVGIVNDQDLEEKRMAVDEQGNLYFMTLNNDPKGSKNTSQNRLWAFSSAGEVKWYRDIDAVVSSPAYYQGTLYYRTARNELYALKAAGGELKWSYQATETMPPLTNNVYFRAAPALGPDGTLYTTFYDKVYALRDQGDQAELEWKSQPAQADSMLYALAGPGPQGELYVTTNVGNALARFTDPDFTPVPYRLTTAAPQYTLFPGGQYQLPVQLLDTYGSQLPLSGLSWESSAPDVAAVDDNGQVTAKSVGEAQITVQHKDYDENSNVLRTQVGVKVVEAAQGCSLSLTPAQPVLTLGQQLPLQAQILTSDGETVQGESIDWKSSSPLATIDSQGLVTAGQQEGTVSISARVTAHPQLQASLNLTVKAYQVASVDRVGLQAAINKAANYVNSNSQGGKVLSDWDVFGLNACGPQLLATADREEYLNQLTLKINDSGVGSLITDYARTSLGILAAGGDPTNFCGQNLIQTIMDYPSLSQGINAGIWALIALDADGAIVPANVTNNRDALIKFILDNRVQEGWSYSGGLPEVDMTGMALYALAPYRDRPEVEAAGEEAIRWLSENQLSNGKFGSWGTVNCESVAQAIMGLTAWGVDPQGPDFTKNTGNAVTALLSYQNASGVFNHVDTVDAYMATPQAVEALAALARFMDTGRSDIYYKISATAASPEEIKSLEVTPAAAEIPVGRRIQLLAENQSGQTVDKDTQGQALIEWKVLDGGDAVQVTEEGLLTGLQPGTADVLVQLKSNPSIQAQAQITVDGTLLETGTPAKPDQPLIGVSGQELSTQVHNVSGKSLTLLVNFVLYKKEAAASDPDTEVKSIVQQSYLEKTLAPDEAYNIAGGFVWPSDGQSYEGKVMIWSGWDGKPLCEPIMISHQ